MAAPDDTFDDLLGTEPAPAPASEPEPLPLVGVEPNAIERPASTGATLNRLVSEFLEAATYDVRELFSTDGGFKSVKDVPRPLTLLIKGVKMKRMMPAEWADVLGTPAAEVVEMRWESQAALLLRAIELVTGMIERQKKNGEPMTDEEIEKGAIEFVLLRHPELAPLLKPGEK